MKSSLKLFLVTIGTALALSFNTSCTPGEAAVVGGIAGAAIGAAAASGGNRHRGYPPRGGWNNHPQNYGPRGGGWNRGPGGQCW